MDYKILECKKKLLNKARDENRELLFHKYEENFLVRYTYESNSMEGNTLSLAETRVVLLDGMAVEKPIKDVNDIWHHSRAFEHVKSCIRQERELDKNGVLKISHLAMDLPLWMSPYRNENVYITGTEYEPPDGAQVPGLMEQYYRDIEEKSAMCGMPECIHPLTLAAYTHAQFVHIHPYLDFNGRTARLLMNYQLMRNGFLAVSISKTRVLRYYNALDSYHFTGDLGPFEELIFEVENEELDKIIEGFKL